MAFTTSESCAAEFLTNGRHVCTLDGPSQRSQEAIQAWVNQLAAKTKAKIDWHFSGGRAFVLFLGEDEEFQRVRSTVLAMDRGEAGKLRIID